MLYGTPVGIAIYAIFFSSSSNPYHLTCTKKKGDFLLAKEKEALSAFPSWNCHLSPSLAFMILIALHHFYLGMLVR